MKQLKKATYLFLYFAALLGVLIGLIFLILAFESESRNLNDLKINFIINTSQVYLLGGILLFILIALWEILDVLKSKSEND
jgi:hypothetical protein